ncbi:MAG: trigger factor [Acidimicrobiales bacterium]|jgi:trigger factor
MDFVKDFTVTKEENSQVKIEGEIPFDVLEKHRAKAIKNYGKDMEIDGFRKGHVPEAEVVKRVGEMGILTEMAERAIAEAYPEACKHHEIDAIGYPQLQITKIAEGNPLGFTATVAVMPEITLPDYKEIAAEVNKEKASIEVTDEEIETQVKDILRQKTAYERMQSAAAKKDESETTTEDMGDTTELPTPETVEADTHTHDDGTVHEGAEHDETQTHTHEDGTVHEGPAHDDEELKAVTDDELPELTDEYVKTLGEPGQFETVKGFKDKIKEHLAIEKEKEVHAAHRAKITDKIVDETVMNLPRILIDSEIEQMFAQMNEDLKRANLEMDDYLGHIKKTKEDLITEWEPAAEKRAKLQLVLNEVAKKEETKPDQAQVDTQVDQLLEQYKDADETRVRVYVASVMTNEAVMKMLEEA